LTERIFWPNRLKFVKCGSLGENFLDPDVILRLPYLDQQTHPCCLAYQYLAGISSTG